MTTSPELKDIQVKDLWNYVLNQPMEPILNFASNLIISILIVTLICFVVVYFLFFRTKSND